MGVMLMVTASAVSCMQGSPLPPAPAATTFMLQRIGLMPIGKDYVATTITKLSHTKQSTQRHV
eukprot:CAMPEP_0115840934 /NCGR_PEP_ID=MMETSP0287-20121206/7028_1 /TAXON_ID=412157 /ORGANISM="Chrysochromulina rotalis, Strain UIO044" /LENGTH=62 /DNA_ID=CAMNT_0003294563 /DNA_START=81 /DNA_END=269 /DNA_ORIENTATION=+